MRTKTKAARRHSTGEMLEGDVSIGTDASVGEVASPNNFNSCPVSSVVIQGSSNDGRSLVSGNGNWVGTLGVAGGLGSFMDVDDRLQRLGVDVHTSLSGRMASGITINEPQSVGVTVTNTCHRSLMDVDGTGKGKRKVDDMPMLMHDGDVGTGVVPFPLQLLIQESRMHKASSFR